MREHPSGRPIRRAREVKRGYWNMPGDGPATPRLRQVGLKDAIGFRLVDPPLVIPDGWDMRPGAMNVHRIK